MSFLRSLNRIIPVTEANRAIKKGQLKKANKTENMSINSDFLFPTQVQLL